MSDFEVCPIGTVARLAAVEAERDALRVELQSALDDWNALVKASGSPTNGGAIGHVLALRAQRDALRALIADDAFASSFQTIYWYRSALLKSAREPIDEALVEKEGGNG